GGVGPDGIEMDSENGLVVCHLGTGVWRFDANMLPTHLVYSERHRPSHLANLAFGGSDYKTIYIAEAHSGDILRAELPFAGKKCSDCNSFQPPQLAGRSLLRDTFSDVPIER